MRAISYLLAAACLAAVPTPTRATEAIASDVPASLTLRDALGLALRHSPALRARGAEVRRAEARTRQAGARPNPDLAFELENVGGGSPVGTEATLTIAQRLELGGKRGARIDAARSEEAVVAADVAAERLAVAGEVTERYLVALAVERLVALADAEVHAAEEASQTMGQRVRAGASHSVEKRRADVELANLRLDRVVLGSDVELARARLSSTWGEARPRFERLADGLGEVPPPPPLDTLIARAETSPALARWGAELEARRRRVDLERAQRVPDLQLQAGMRRLDDLDAHTFVGGVSLPLPLFDRRSGAIDEAAAAVSQAEGEEARARVGVRLALAERHVALERSREKLAALRTEVLPEAELAFTDIELGFSRGRFSYLDLIEARRTLLRARREELNTLLAAHVASAEIARLVGAPLDGGEAR